MKFIDATHLEEDSIQISDPGETVIFVYNVSKELVVNLATKDARAYIYGIFVGRNDERHALKTVQLHSSPSTVSDLFVRGVFDDASQFSYEGLIRIEKDAQASRAYQKNQNLLRSESAHVMSKPFLEILADDVSCTHGSTTAGVRQQELFYLMSRGIDDNGAQKIIAEGYIEVVFQKLADHGIVREVEAYKQDVKKRIYE